MGVNISIFDGNDKKLVKKKSLPSQGVKDGDKLTWIFFNEKDLMSVKIVSEKDASEERTVTITKNTRFSDLSKYLLRMGYGENGGSTFVFQSNGTTINNAQRRQNMSNIKDGDTISWRIGKTAEEIRSRYHEKKKESRNKKRLKVMAKKKKRQNTKTSKKKKTTPKKKKTPKKKPKKQGTPRNAPEKKSKERYVAKKKRLDAKSAVPPPPKKRQRTK